MKGWLLALLLLGSACRNTVEARAAAGGPLSKPAVHAEVTLHKEFTLVWGDTITYRLDIEVDGQRYRTEDVNSATAVSISPDRKTFAVLDRELATWQRYSLGADEFSPGFLTLVQEGDPLDQLRWPENSLEPVADYSFLQWVALGSLLAGVAVGAALWRRRRARAA